MIKKSLLALALFGAVVSQQPANAELEINEVLLVNEFGAGTGANVLGGSQGGDGEAPGLCYPNPHYTVSSATGMTGESLKLDFDVRAPGSFTFYWMKLGPKTTDMGGTATLDLSGKKYLSFWVRGKEGRERFKVEIHQDADADGLFTAGKDISGHVYVDSYLKKGIEKDWTKVCIPLADIRRITDWSKIIEIVFTFENHANLLKSGTVYVDDIVFGSAAPTKPVAPAFKPVKGSLKIDGQALSDAHELKGASGFTVELEGDLARAESVWIVASYDTFSWKTLGKAFVGEGKEAKGTLNPYILEGGKSVTLDVWAFDLHGGKATLDAPFKDIKPPLHNDDAFLDEMQKRAFRFFWDAWHPQTGLIRDATHNEFSSIASTGFGLASYCMAVERGWVGREEAAQRISKTIDTFLNKAQNKSGFFYHFLTPSAVTRFGTCEISVVDTAILVWGLLTAGDYFGSEIREGAEKIYSRIVWKDFLVQDPEDIHYNQFVMGWIPEGGPNGKFLTTYWDYYTDELILINFLAIASPSHPVDPSVFYGWKREKSAYGSGQAFVQSWHGGLFAYQYAHDWIDFRGRKDREGVNWWQNTIDAVAANRQFAMDHMDKSKSYGPLNWGITSMAYPNVTPLQGIKQIAEDYTMHHGTLPCGTETPVHDGTVSPYGPASSVPYLPEISIRSLRHVMVTLPQMWGMYGFRSAYNLDLEWFSTNYYGIDLGNAFMAIENYRNGFFWNLMNKNAYVRRAFELCGFVEDKTVYEPPVFKEAAQPGPEAKAAGPAKGRVVEDFSDAEDARAGLGVKFGAWDKDPGDKTQGATVEIDTDQSRENTGASLRIDYDVDSPNAAFNGVWFKLDNLDASQYQALEFWIKGVDGASPARFKVELKGSGQLGSTYIGGIDSTWKRISIPLSQFRGLNRLDALNELTLVFEDHAVGQKTGTIYVDDIQFGDVSPGQ